MINDKYIDVGVDFSIVPAGRTSEDGPASGERFRKEFLLKYLNDPEIGKIIIDFSNIYQSIGSSFIDEAFGYLIREGKLTESEFKNKIALINTLKDPLLVERIFANIQEQVQK